MYSGQGLSCVYANGSQGTFDAVQHLFQTGKKRIAYIKGITEYRSLNNRFSGYQNAFIANGLAIDNSLIYEGNLTIESGYRAAETFMKLETPPDAIVAGTDLMAIGVLDYLRKNNIRVPEDVAVFGYANLHIAQNSLPPLSTVATPISEMAESAINMVIELMNGKHETPVEKVFKCELKIRESSAAIL
jgi:DNA-binding LacI/PurR family transcriptional regulator